jgi:hypothetical protein
MPAMIDDIHSDFARMPGIDPLTRRGLDEQPESTDPAKP